MNIYIIAIVLIVMYYYVTFWHLDIKNENRMGIFVTASLTALILLYAVSSNRSEGFTSDEAVQNLASMYNKDEIKVGNLIVTGKATISDLEVKDKLTVLSPSTFNGKLLANGNIRIPKCGGIQYDNTNGDGYTMTFAGCNGGQGGHGGWGSAHSYSGDIVTGANPTWRANWYVW